MDTLWWYLETKSTNGLMFLPTYENTSSKWLPERIGMIIAGFEVPHMHIHLIPANTMSDMDFSLASDSVDAADLERAAESIKSALEN